MNYLLDLQLNLNTLLLFLAVPFLYFFFHVRYWYKPQTFQAFDAFLTGATIILGTIVSLKMLHAIGERNLQAEDTKIIILHLAPLLLTILILKQGKTSAGFIPRRFRSHIPGAAAPAQAAGYLPSPLNKDVERVTWDNLIVEDSLKAELVSVINLLKDPKTAKKYGIDVPKGILLTGPPGTGKTSIAKVIAHTAGLSFFVLKMDEVVSKWVGESEKNLSALFHAAAQHSPAVIFIDEVDSIGKSRSGANPTYADNLLNHLLQLIDGVVRTEGLYIVAATNRADLVDEALKRPGRLTKILDVPLPDAAQREQIFNLYLSKLHLDAEINMSDLIAVTEGNSAADIKEICNQAGLNAFKRESLEGKKSYRIRSQDLHLALKDFAAAHPDSQRLKQTATNRIPETSYRPRPVSHEVEPTTWDDLIIAPALQEELQSVIALLRDADSAKRYGIKPPKGILLYGPPGTGKTSIAKAIAHEASLSFFALQMDEVISKWVGESEKNLSKLFHAAVLHAPAVIFIDEIDSIGKNRAAQNATHADNLLNHLLQLIDGVISKKGIYIIGATNRQELVDPALVRSGRLTRSIEVPLPDESARKQIFSLYLSRLPLSEPVDAQILAAMTAGKSGADIQEICNQAGLHAFRRESAQGITREYMVQPIDIEKAVREFTQGIKASPAIMAATLKANA